MGNVWEWGKEVGGHSWRTAGDLGGSFDGIGSALFRDGFDVYARNELHKYGGPGGWNDPDYLLLGYLSNWKGETAPTPLTPNEQYTHVSLWCLLAAPLIFSGDITRLDDFTLEPALTNDEVIDVDQDPLGKPGRRVAKDGDLEVWAKDMEDGSQGRRPVQPRRGRGRRSPPNGPTSASPGTQIVRDLWRQKDLGELRRRVQGLRRPPRRRPGPPAARGPLGGRPLTAGCGYHEKHPGGPMKRPRLTGAHDRCSDRPRARLNSGPIAVGAGGRRPAACGLCPLLTLDGRTGRSDAPSPGPSLQRPSSKELLRVPPQVLVLQTSSRNKKGVNGDADWPLYKDARGDDVVFEAAGPGVSGACGGRPSIPPPWSNSISTAKESRAFASPSSTSTRAATRSSLAARLLREAGPVGWRAPGREFVRARPLRQVPEDQRQG